MSYVHHIWDPGEAIRANLMNNLEDGIQDLLTSLNKLDENTLKVAVESKNSLSNVDLDSIITPGLYYASTSGNAGTITNGPITDQPYALIVIKSTLYKRIHQIALMNYLGANKKQIAVRFGSSGTTNETQEENWSWSSWRFLVDSTVTDAINTKVNQLDTTIQSLNTSTQELETSLSELSGSFNGLQTIELKTDNVTIFSEDSFDKYTTPGTYIVPNSDIASNITNYPDSSNYQGGRLIVMKILETTTGSARLIQFFITNSNSSHIYVRHGKSQRSWDTWIQICPSDTTLKKENAPANAKVVGKKAFLTRSVVLNTENGNENAVADFNLMTEMGRYTLVNSQNGSNSIVNALNKPEGASYLGNLLVFSPDDDSDSDNKAVITQIYIDTQTNGYYRVRNNSKNWSSWKQVFKTDKTLTIENTPADAKSVGDKIEELEKEIKGEVIVSYGDFNQTLEASTQDSYPIDTISVEKNGNIITLAGTNTTANTGSIKISGEEIDRRRGTTGPKNWSTGIELIPNHLYKISANLLSGSASINPDTNINKKIKLFAYEVGTSINIAKTYYQDSNIISFFIAGSEQINIGFYLSSGVNTTFNNATYQIILTDVITNSPNEIYRYKKKNFLNNLPFYKIETSLTEYRRNYIFKNDNWTLGSTITATKILPCPRFLIVNFKNIEKNLFIYIGNINNSGEFEVDSTNYCIRVNDTNEINMFNGSTGFVTQETDGSKYMWIGIEDDGTSNNNYDDYFNIIGADEWPKSPINVDSWTFINADINRYVRYDGIDENLVESSRKSYVLPEKSWIFTRNLTNPLLTYNNSSSTDRPWNSTQQNCSCFYIPEGAGLALLTCNESDLFNEDNVCIVPEILDQCISSNGYKTKQLANKILNNFYFVAKNNTIKINDDNFYIIGKTYYSIPYSPGWNAHHIVCYDTTPETAINAANDEYSVFYDTNSQRQELGGDDNNRAGYGGVCSVFGSLAMGCPYPQTTNGFLTDKNFEVQMCNNPRSGDVCLKLPRGDHALMVDDVFKNGYSIYEWYPPGITKAFRTTNSEDKIIKRTTRSYMDDYNFIVNSKDRSGWKTNYINFNYNSYQIPEGPVRPWRGNKCVYSSYDLLRGREGENRWYRFHNGINITLHGLNVGDTIVIKNISTEQSIEIQVKQKKEAEEDFYAILRKKKGGTTTNSDQDTTSTSSATVMNIDEIIAGVPEDENQPGLGPGEYALYVKGETDESKFEYFRYFDYNTRETPVILQFDEDGTATFSSDDVDYAYASDYDEAVTADYFDPETGESFPVTATVIAKGKKYPGFNVTNVKCAMVRDTTEKEVEDNGKTIKVEDSWGRYPVYCQVENYSM